MKAQLKGLCINAFRWFSLKNIMYTKLSEVSLKEEKIT